MSNERKLHKKEMILKSDEWKKFDFENETDEEIIEFIKTYTKDGISDSWFVQRIEWDICKKDAYRVFIDPVISRNDLGVKESSEWQNVYDAFYYDGYIKFFSFKKLDVDIHVNAIMWMNSSDE